MHCQPISPRLSVTSLHGGALLETDPGSVRTSNLRTKSHAIGLLQPYCLDGMVCATLTHLENEADVASCCNVVRELMPHRTPSGRNGPGGCDRFQVALRIEPQLCRNAKVASWCAHALALASKQACTHIRTHTLMRLYRGRLATIGRWKPRRHPIVLPRAHGCGAGNRLFAILAAFGSSNLRTTIM